MVAGSATDLISDKPAAGIHNYKHQHTKKGRVTSQGLSFANRIETL
jgi:hypothetical protein